MCIEMKLLNIRLFLSVFTVIIIFAAGFNVKIKVFMAENSSTNWGINILLFT